MKPDWFEDPRGDQQERRLELCGLVDPGLTEREVEHDRRLAEQDRLREKGGNWRTVARQPHPTRERRRHRKSREELDAQLALYGDRPVDSQVQPLGRRAA